MQVNRINSNAYIQARNGKVQKNINNKQNTNNTSFKGGALDTCALGIANAIENGGLFVSFTLQDMLGTNIPRPVMGLLRNSKENDGQKNTKFAAKELVREMLTGPSMFIIPMGMLAAGKKMFGKTINIPMKAIKAFGEVHAENPLNAAGKAIGKEDFYRNTFAEMLKNAKLEEKASDSTIKTAGEFAQKITGAGNKKELGEAISELSAKFVDISKSHADDAVFTDFTQAVVKDNTSSFKDAVTNMMSYADDIVVKAAKDANPENIKKLTNKSIGKRFATNILMYGAVLAFLQLIPKMYNKAEGEDNAGLKGLMTEETFKDEPQNNKEANKSKPSFGSSQGFVDAVTGNKLAGRIAHGMEFDGYNVSFPMLLSIMGVGILLPRIINSKDKYDREEIVRRDVTTCTTMCFAEKALRKIFSKYNENKSGLVLADKTAGFKEQSLPKRIFDYFRPIKGVNVMDSQQIIAKYSNIDRYKDGAKGFCDFISGQGGNLSKVFSLTDESKALVEEMLGEGRNIAEASNEEITNAIANAQGSETLQKLTDLFKLQDKKSASLLEKLFKLNKEKTNPWVEKAQTLNARFTALSVVILVPAFLGFFLPWLNERATKKRIKEEQANKINSQNNMFNNIAPKNPKVFEDIAAFSQGTKS